MLIIVTFVAYQPVWHAGFIWDDDDHLTANPAMTAPHGLRMIWSSLAVSRYYPLTLTSFWIQHQLWGLNPLPYHLINIALHASNGILVFLVLRRLRVTAAWLAAAVWVLHPVNVESVAWITELKNTQSGFFFFGALLCFLRFEAEDRRRWYALALLCGAGAVLSKPSTVVLPLVLLWCIWWERGRWRRRDIVRTLPFFVLASFMSVITIVEQRGHVLRQGTAEWSIGVLGRAVVAGKSIGFYLGKILWPADLAFVYPRWKVTNSAWSCLPLAAVVAVGVTLWAWRRRAWARAGFFGFGFFVTALLPVLGFFDVYYFRYSFVADHFQYLASLGIIACVTSGIWHILNRYRMSEGLAQYAVCTPLLVILASLTWRQGHIYRDQETLWQDTVAKNPGSSPAYNNLGVILVSQDRVSEAIGDYERALTLKPDFAEAHNNLGVALVRTGKADEAKGQYEQALRINPEYAAAHYNLGDVLLQTGRLNEAIGQYEQALRIDPNYAEAYNNLGVALARQGRVPEAIGQYEQAVRVKPDFAEAHCNLGDVLGQVGRVSEAIGHYEQALRIKPDFTDARVALARLRSVPQ